MKKTYLTTAVVLALASSITMNSCIGSFALTNKVLAWNKQIGSKFVNALVFVGLHILPVYELSFVADILVINSIEFWSGDNPVTASTRIIDGKDAKYLVKCDKSGYTITNLSNKNVVKFDYNRTDNSWSLNTNGKSTKFMQFVDDSHVKMITPNGDLKTVELSQEGLMAYEQMANANLYAMK